ncbi:helix-turn-helix transcriptional regulator [Streptomyces sodiiphilus]|uniref:Helix-turn-helix transcriptional regulator n=1 Tax=Streptomyces sodiiphilus TaxID=226217 RepID=A0ABN2PI36_9ACTN
MSTDFREARISLGLRLRELRTEGGLTGRALAGRLGWPQSKISKLENGRQTPTPEDLRAWAEATGSPEAAAELAGRLRGLETQYRSWRRQLSGGYRAVQDTHRLEGSRTRDRRSLDPSLIPGLLQTPAYAHAVLRRFAAIHSAPDDVTAAVRARLQRQEVLSDRTRSFHFLLWEGALRSRPCPPEALREQLDHICQFLASAHVRLGVVPFGAELELPPLSGFSLHDDRLVITEAWHAEMWLDDPADVRLYRRVWDACHRTAVHGAEAHRLIIRARRALLPE